MSSLAPQAPLWRLALQLLPMLVAVAMPLGVRSVSTASAQAGGEGDVRLSPAMATVPVSDGPFTVYVVLEGLQHFGRVSYDDNRDGTPDRSTPSDGLGAFQFTIEYDPTIVEFQDVERGPSLGLTGRSFQCLPAARETGTIMFGCLSPGSSPAGPQGTLTLASVQFAPLANGLSPMVLAAEVSGPLGDSAAVDVSGGAVRVTGESAPANPTRLATKGTKTPAVRTPALTMTPIGTAVSPGEATATAVARATNARDGTPGGTPTALVGGQTGTPTRTDDQVNQDDGSNNHLWLWSLGVAAALVCGALGVTAVVWQRRGGGSS